MPTYYFDIREDSHLTTDTDGLELPDTASAEREAIDAATLIARDALSSRHTSRIAVEVRDNARPVCAVSVSLQVNGT
jgi:hypothetical protein